MTTAGTAGDDAANILDPLNIAHKTHSALPGYQTALAQQQANQARLLTGQGTSGPVGSITSGGGQRQVMVNGLPQFDANGQPIMEGIAGDGSNRSVIDQLHDNSGRADSLTAANNPYLTAAGNGAWGAASGLTGAINGQAATTAINGARDANGAVRTPLDAQRSDLGIVRGSALGTGPSAATNLAQSQLDASIRSQAALAATARGGNIASAMRSAAASGTQQQLQSQAQVAQMRAQEQLNAQGILTQGAGNLTGATQANANQAGVLSGQNVQQSAISGQMIQAGLQGQQAVSGQYAQQQQAAQAAKNAAEQQWADYIQKQYSLSSGIPVNYAATQGALSQSNAASSAQNQAGLVKLVSAII